MTLILSGTDGLSDVDGSAATPAIRGTDANTGIFFPAADTIAFSEGGVESMRIDSAGNLGLGVTPSASTTAGTIYFPSNTTFGRYGYTQNSYFNGTNYIYSSSSQASLYQASSGQHVFYTAPSGTAGNTISFTQAMTLDASGNLGIGTSSPSAQLDVSRSSTSGYSTFRLSNSGASGKTYEIGVGGNAPRTGLVAGAHECEPEGRGVCACHQSPLTFMSPPGSTRRRVRRLPEPSRRKAPAGSGSR